MVREYVVAKRGRRMGGDDTFMWLILFRDGRRVESIQTVNDDPEHVATVAAGKWPDARFVPWKGCVVCGREVRDYYMVTDTVWRREAGFGDGYCHLRCLERQIGRPLTRADFPELPVNVLIHFGFERGAEQA